MTQNAINGETKGDLRKTRGNYDQNEGDSSIECSRRTKKKIESIIKIQNRNQIRNQNQSQIMTTTENQ